MAYIFRNLLIVERNSTHPASQFLKGKGEWFQPRQPFEYTSPHDKIIVSYANVLTHSSNVESLEGQNVTYDGQVDGVVKLNCDGNNLKIFYFQFTSADLFRKHIAQVREYLLSLIRGMPQSGAKYSVNWKKGLLKDEAERIVHSIGLLGNRESRSHTFTEEEIRGNTFVTMAPSPAPAFLPTPGCIPSFSLSTPSPFPPVSNMMSWK
jgi:hypothetical protein